MAATDSASAASARRTVSQGGSSSAGCSGRSVSSLTPMTIARAPPTMPGVALIDGLLDARRMLGEGSMYERLRRDPAVRFDAEMAHATLIYDDASRAVLERTHREYLDIGQDHGVPMLTATDTWRANRERQDRSPFRDHPVNQD